MAQTAARTMRSHYGGLVATMYKVGCKATTHELYYRKFLSQDYLKLPNGAKVLDCGCGGGRFAVNLLRELRKRETLDTVVHALDISKKMLKIAEKSAKKCRVQQNLELYHADCRYLPFKNDCFDIVMSSGMLECVPNPERAIKEMMRVLKPKGQIVIASINDNLLGKAAGLMLQFRVLPEGYLIEQLSKIKNLQKCKVRSFNVYIKTLKSIYVGTKAV